MKSSDEILAHPRFAQARRAHINAFAQVFEGNHALLGLLTDSAALTLGTLLVGFHAVFDPENPATWATHGRVSQIIADGGQASRRRMAGLIDRFRASGWIESVVLQTDHRVRIIKPTRTLLRHDRIYVAALYRFLETMFPDRGYERIGQNPALHLAVRREQFRILDQATAFMHRNPEIMYFLHRDAGYVALLLAAQADLAGDPISFSALAEPLGVSRTHIRKIFAEPSLSELLDIGPRGGRIRLRPSLWNAFDRFLCDLEAVHYTIAAAAIHSEGASPTCVVAS